MIRLIVFLSSYTNLVSFGISPQGRNLYCLIASKDKAGKISLTEILYDGKLSDQASS